MVTFNKFFLSIILLQTLLDVISHFVVLFIVCVFYVLVLSL